MNKDRVKGAIDEVVGTAKRKAGEWTGDTPLQVKGLAQQAKGGVETAVGKAKEALHDASKNAEIHVEVQAGHPAKASKHPKCH